MKAGRFGQGKHCKMLIFEERDEICDQIFVHSLFGRVDIELKRASVKKK